MNEIITEKNYPVQGLWIFKSNFVPLFTLLFSSLIFFLAYYAYDTSETSKDSEAVFYIFLLMVGLSIIYFIDTILKRANFHYSIEEKFLTVKQGILSKQQRHIPYGAIQNLFVKQDLLDRIFGLASLTIENASQGSGALGTPRQQVEIVGFFGNKVIIPGLTQKDAEILKGIILQKMKENPIDDSQSGL